MMRRTVCLTLAAAALSGVRVAMAQSGRAVRIAWVSSDVANPESPFLLSFRAGMRSFGWVDGQNAAIETWWGGGSPQRLKEFIPDVVATRPNLIVAAGGSALRPLIDANVGPPIVFALSADAVLGKAVNGWARPGVNRTGISLFSLELVPKRLELIKDLIPGIKRVAIVGWPPHGGELLEIEAAAAAAQRLGLQHRYFGANTGQELDAAFDVIDQWKPEAILAFAGGLASAHADRFAAFSVRRRIPVVSAWAVFAEAGNLLTYGPVLEEVYARLASFADRILKGANAAELPVERPTKFELVINMKVAKAIGIQVPQSVLVRADRVIA